MAKKEKAIDKLSKILNAEKDKFSDNSASWVRVENDNYSIDFVFDGNGNTLEDIKVAKKVYQVVNEKIISTFKF